MKQKEGERKEKISMTEKTTTRGKERKGGHESERETDKEEKRNVVERETERQIER